ncbi:MAG TPA: ABC transporter family substrate-binding protein [Nocardioidaceae bacterium]|nr:ABC transporter family substrate-binding protein [Nocardioidaceae bacterium]
MRRRRLFAATAVTAALSLALTACGGGGDDDDEGTNRDEATKVTVGWNQPFYSFNSCTTNGNAVANTNPLYLLNTNFWYYNPELEIVHDETFGHYEKVSDEPLTVKYTIADDNKWSDGVELDATDMMLYWAAASGNFNTIGADKVEYDEETGALKFPKGSVFFDTSSAGLSLVKDTPVISDDGKSITLVYSEAYADWELDMSCILPAHVVAKHAGLGDDPAAAKEALLTAIQNKDSEALGPVSEFWSTGFDKADMPTGDDADIAIGNGPYTLKALEEDEFMTFEKNPDYKGEFEANIDEITIVWNEDPVSQLQQLENGEISMMSPQMTADVAQQAQSIEGVEMIGFNEGTYEHFDLEMRKGPFSPKTYGGDEAKALAVRKAFLTALPRQEIVDKLIKPINPQAEVRNSFTNVPGSPNYDLIVGGNGMAEQYDGDIDEAKQILADAGVETPIQVEVMFAEGNSRREAEFPIYKAALAKAGFNLKDERNVDWGSKLGDRSYDAVYFGWASSSTAVSSDYETFGTDRINNLIGYSNPQVDEIFLEINKTTDPAKLGELQLEAEKLLVQDAIGATIFQFPGAIIYNTAFVTNVADPPLSLVPTMFYGFWDWEVP